MLMIRRFAASLLAVMLVAYAPAAFGLQPDKIFTLSMSSVSLSGTVVATITNASPNGNSSITSTSSCDGSLGCDTRNSQIPDTAHVSGAKRLPNNKDGTACVLVIYDFTV